MKNSKIEFWSLSATQARLITISLLLFLMLNITANSKHFIVGDNNVLSIIPLPDTLYEDSTAAFISGDTVETYLDGPNEVHVLFSDTITIPDSLVENLWLFTDNQPLIRIELAHNNGEVEKGLFGINISGMFEEGLAKPGDLTKYDLDPDPWDYLSDLKPSVLRFPSGAGSKFMQLLGVSAGGTNVFKGYGYDIDEILPYYDKTNLFMNEVLYSEILDDLDDNGLCDACGEWMDLTFKKDLEGVFKKWDEQEFFNASGLALWQQNDLAINQFIDLIDKIETDNIATGHIVDVIVCLDILNTTATEAVEIVEYLRSNNKHNVNVVAVELGNEVMAKFFRQAMFFKGFDYYYDYINGGNYSGLPGTFDISDAVPTDVLGDHNFISALKSASSINDIVKIGLPGANLPNCGFYPFKTDPEETDQDVFEMLGIGDPCTYPEWNTDMLDNYDDVITTDFVSRYAFDAIVIHPYYTATNTHDPIEFINTNWGGILIPEYPEVCLDGNDGTEILNYYIGQDPWDYVTMDTRLQCAFEGLVGVGLLDGNFKEFIKIRYNDAYEKHAEELLFEDTDTDPDNKEIWTTEWNFQDSEENATGIEKDFYGVATNSFVHAELLQEWFLKNVKANFDPHFRDNFFTYATLQNYMGTTGISLLTPSKLRDQVELGLEDVVDCDDDELGNYYVPKTTYHEMDLLKEISSNDLNFLKSTTTMYSGNINQPPTVFIPGPAPALANQDVYVYFTNVKDDYQIYCIDPGTLGQIFTPDLEIELDFDDITVFSIEADQLYSNSGTSTLFSINDHYDVCDELEPNMFEINGLTSYVGNVSCPGGWGVDGGVCVRVNAYSTGYFIIPYDAELRIGEVQDLFMIYPNPASTHFIVQQMDIEIQDLQSMQVEIYNIYGGLIQKVTAEEGQSIDISQLPVGVYTVLIGSEGNNPETETLIKMK